MAVYILTRKCFYMEIHCCTILGAFSSFEKAETFAVNYCEKEGIHPQPFQIGEDGWEMIFSTFAKEGVFIHKYKVE